MSSYMLRGVPPGLIPKAKARAREREESLDAMLIRVLESYANGTRSAGGEGRAAALSAETRSEIASNAAQARWKK